MSEYVKRCCYCASDHEVEHYVCKECRDSVIKTGFLPFKSYE